MIKSSIQREHIAILNASASNIRAVILVCETKTHRTKKRNGQVHKLEMSTSFSKQWIKPLHRNQEEYRRINNTINQQDLINTLTENSILEQQKVPMKHIP